MDRKAVSGIMLTLLLISMLTMAFNLQLVKASGTIYIRADGSVEPPTAPILNVGNVSYTFTDNINDPIMVERSNITIDGAGHSVVVLGQACTLQNVSNVTIKNTTIITSCCAGIYLNSTIDSTVSGNNIRSNYWGVRLIASSFNIISGNNIKNNHNGILLEGSSDYNIISENNITNNNNIGVGLHPAPDNVISGNNVTNNYYGIWLSNSPRNTISGNNVEGNKRGVWVAVSHRTNFSRNSMTNNFVGVVFDQTSRSNASSNSVTYNDDGIWFLMGSSNSISGNNITANDGDGVKLVESSNNVFRDNVIAGSKKNFGVFGYERLHFVHDVNASNTVNGKPILYLVNRQNLTVNPQTHPNIGYLAVVNSTNITVQQLNMENNGQGVLLAYTKNSTTQNVVVKNNTVGIQLTHSSNNSIIGNYIRANNDGILLDDFSDYNTLSGNNIANNGGGMYIYSSSYNSISGNNMTSNSSDGIYLISSSNNIISRNNITDSWCGIWLFASSDNKFYHNNFIDNTQQVYIEPFIIPLTNNWDDGYPSGGNYWSDYMDVDLFSGPDQDVPGSDGIWDHPYILDADNQDRYPLVEPWTPTLGDVNGDGRVDASDLFDLSKAYGSDSSKPNWNPNCDLDNDDKVDASDLFALSKNYGKTV